MATKQNVTKDSANVVTLNLSDIDFDRKWNARSNVETGTGGPDEEGEGTGGLLGLALSIATEGQDTPVIVRPHPKGGKRPYSGVAGFRREAAIMRIYHPTEEDSKDAKVTRAFAAYIAKMGKVPTIRAEIREMTEGEARRLNLRENTARDSLSGPDLAFGVAAMKKSNVGITDSDIANDLGMNQSYISKLCRIMETVDDNVLRDWRSSTTKVSVADMAKLLTVPKDEHSAKFRDMLNGKSSKPVGRGAWIGTVMKSAERYGKILGTLARKGAIELDSPDTFFDVSSDDKEELSHTIAVFVGMQRFDGTGKGKATDNQRAKVGDAAKEAYEAALNGEEETPKGKGKGKGKGASAEAN